MDGQPPQIQQHHEETDAQQQHGGHDLAARHHLQELQDRRLALDHSAQPAAQDLEWRQDPLHLKVWLQTDGSMWCYLAGCLTVSVRNQCFSSSGCIRSSCLRVRKRVVRLESWYTRIAYTHRQLYEVRPITWQQLSTFRWRQSPNCHNRMKKKDVWSVSELGCWCQTSCRSECFTNGCGSAGIQLGENLKMPCWLKGSEVRVRGLEKGNSESLSRSKLKTV